MSSIGCFVSFMLCYNLQTFAFYDKDQVRQLVSEACPYTKFCHRDAWKIKPNDTRQPCCKPCSCDDDCWELDNCCPDKELINEPRPPIVPCIDSHKSRNADSNPYDGFYRVIDSCPSYEGILYPEPKCNRNNRTSVEDLIWVSDKAGKIYLNIYCAKCHGIKETIPWQIQSTCYDIMRATFDELLETLLSEKCNLVNKSPETLSSVTARYKCYNPSKLIYSSCNETGLMKHYTPDVETACRQTTWPFILGSYMTKNIFCAMCNEDLHVPYNASYDGRCSFIEDRNKGTPITFLLDYKSISTDTTETGSKCGIDEIFDELVGLCRKVLCPVGTAPFYGRCKQLVSQINGLAISVQYYLDVIWSQDGVFTDYGYYIHTQFMELVDLNSDCNVCRKMIDMTEGNESTSDLILVVTVKFSAKCEYGLALTQLSNIRGKVFDIHINGASVLTLLVRSDKQPISLIKQGSYQTIYLYSFDCQPKYALLFEDMICPRLELNYTEHKLFSQTKPREKEIFASFFMINGTQQNVSRVSVCLEKYFSVMSLNRAYPSDGKMTLQILAALVLVLTANHISCS